MKKIGVLLSALSSVLLLAGCPGSQTKVNVEIKYGSYVDTTLRSINQAKLQEMVEGKESFILAVSPKSSGCVCWHDFKIILESYIKQEHMIVYEINYSDFFDAQGKALERFGITIHENEETFVLFNKGELSQNIVYNAKNSIFKEYNAFLEFINKLIDKPHMYFVNEESMAQRVKENGKAIVYFARNNCPDCQYVDTNFLKPYSFEFNQNLYIIDCESLGIREYKLDEEGKPTSTLTDESAVKWQQFKDKYELSYRYDEEKAAYVGNEQYGYNTGYVPTFQVREYDASKETKSNVIGASVYFNDGRLVEVGGGAYAISDSFYSEERKPNLPYNHTTLKGKQLSRDEISINEYEKDGEKFTYVSWRIESKAKYHNENLKNFLEYYYPLMTK